MSGRGEPLGDIFAAEEARRIEETRRELEAEAAAWNALSDEERAERFAAAERKAEEFERRLAEAEAAGEDDDDEDDDEEDFDCDDADA